MKPIVDHTTLIEGLGGDTAVANHIHSPEQPCNRGRVQQWRFSNSIPPQYWPELIIMAASRDLNGINADWFMRTVPKRKQQAVSAAA